MILSRIKYFLLTVPKFFHLNFSLNFKKKDFFKYEKLYFLYPLANKYAIVVIYDACYLNTD